MTLLLIYASIALAGVGIAFWRQPALPHAWPLLAIAAAPQLLSMVGVRGLGLFLVTCSALGLWCWRNRRLPGVALVTVGFALNLLVMGLHGGAMPIHSESLAALGHTASVGTALADSKDVVVNDATLGFLGDWIVVTWLPIHFVASPGDLLVLLGIARWLLSGNAPRRLTTRIA